MSRDLNEGPSLVFTSPENQAFALLLEPLLDGGTNRENLVTVSVERVHVPRKVRITLDLRGQDRRGGADVTEGCVRLLMFPAEVEACGGREIAGLLAMEDSLHVDHPPRAVVEIEVGPLELGDQHREVEAADIEAPKVAGIHQVEERFCASAEGCFARHVFVGDPVYGLRLRINGAARIETSDPFHDVALWRNPQDRHLDDTILLGTQSGGLQVEENQGPVELDG